MKQKQYLKLSALVLGAWVATGAVALAEQSSLTNDPPEVTLEALVAEALATNPEINFYQAEIAAAKGEKRTASAWTNPELSAELGHKSVSGGGISGEGVAWSLSVMQPFEYPGRIALRKAIANRQIELAELGYEQFRAALAFRIRVLGYALLAAQEKAAAAQQVAARGRELAEVLVQRDPAGVTPLLETRIIEATVIVAMKRAADASKEAKISLYELNQLRGAPLSMPLRMAKIDLKFEPVAEPEELLALARTNNFEVRVRQVELAQQGLRVDLSKNERKPALTAGPFYSQEGGDETERVAGLGLSMPLPLWNRNQAGIQIAKARQEQAETSLLVTQRQVERTLLETIAAYNSHLEQMAFWRPDSLQHLREAAELGDRHYRLGALPVSTYTELQDKFMEATEAILDTRQAALESFQQIQMLTGRTSLPLAAGIKGVGK